jgi:hypothetical protein
MKKSVASSGIVFLVLAASGCSSSDPNSDAPAVNKTLSTLVPEYTEVSKVRLPEGRRYVSLGDSEEKAASVFPRSSRGFDFPDQLIPGLPSDFKAKGWESSTKGFGVILHDDKVVLAMEQLESIEADEFASLLENIKTVNGLDRFQAVTQDKAEYWFTKMGTDVLAISRVAGSKKRYQVTVTIGNEHLLDALGILKDVKKEDIMPKSEKHAL